MMKRLSVVALGLAIMASSLCAFGEDDKAKLDERLTAATSVISESMSAPDKGIPSSILSGASCVVVIPSFKKGAFIGGVQYGQGAATCRTPNGWSAPVFVQLAGGSFGFQAGGQATDLVLIAMNQQGLQEPAKCQFFAERAERDAEDRDQNYGSAVLQQFRHGVAGAGRLHKRAHQGHPDGGGHAGEHYPKQRQGRGDPPQRAPKGAFVLRPEHQHQGAEQNQVA